LSFSLLSASLLFLYLCVSVFMWDTLLTRRSVYFYSLNMEDERIFTQWYTMHFVIQIVLVSQKANTHIVLTNNISNAVICSFLIDQKVQVWWKPLKVELTINVFNRNTKRIYYLQSREKNWLCTSVTHGLVNVNIFARASLEKQYDWPLFIGTKTNIFFL
jgi:hypothetical protein